MDNLHKYIKYIKVTMHYKITELDEQFRHKQHYNKLLCTIHIFMLKTKTRRKRHRGGSRGVMGVKRPPLPESYGESLKSGVVA